MNCAFGSSAHMGDVANSTAYFGGDGWNCYFCG